MELILSYLTPQDTTTPQMELILSFPTLQDTTTPQMELILSTTTLREATILQVDLSQVPISQEEEQIRHPITQPILDMTQEHWLMVIPMKRLLDMLR